MTNNDDARRAHDVLDGLFAGRILSRENEQLLRSFLPEMPKQKTLEGVATDVYIAWNETYGSDWEEDTFGDLEVWLGELYEHLCSLADAEPAKPAHPEFLETEADYAAAPEGTIVACEDSPPWHKFDSTWLSTITHGRNDAKGMTGIIRRVLRWGDGE